MHDYSQFIQEVLEYTDIQKCFRWLDKQYMVISQKLLNKNIFLSTSQTISSKLSQNITFNSLNFWFLNSNLWLNIFVET